MPSGTECVCCKEITEMVNKISSESEGVECIILHPGFQSVCLSPWDIEHASLPLSSLQTTKNDVSQQDTYPIYPLKNQLGVSANCPNKEVPLLSGSLIIINICSILHKVYSGRHTENDYA